MEFAPKLPVPVFPLPNLLLFPQIVVPLHVFELRYRTMVRDALSGERMIAMGLLKPGWERDYHGSPEFHALGCLARFEEVEWLPDDCYSLVVRGLSRVTIGRVTREYPYRAAHVRLVPQEPCSENDPLILSEKQVLLDLQRKLASRGTGIPGGAFHATPEGPAGEPGFEALVNALCMAVDAEPNEKLELLALDSLIERGRRVIELAQHRPRPRAGPEPGSGERN